MTASVSELSEVVGVTRACTALEVSRPSYYRRRRPAPRRTPEPRPSPRRALRPSERHEVIEVLHSERFCDQAPAQIVAALLQEGIYHCSARTMLTHRESGELAAELLEQTYHKQGVDPEQLTVHADRGSAPTSKTLKQMMIDLGVKRAHSRPRVSNAQSLQRIELPHAQIATGVPGALRLLRRCRRLLQAHLRLVQPRASPLGHRDADARPGALRARRTGLGAAAAHPRCRVRRPP